MSVNPLLAPSPLPFELPDFAVITADHLREALDVGMAEEEAAWEAVATESAIPDVANTLIALEKAGNVLDRATAILDTYAGSLGGEPWESIETEYMPRLAAHADKLLLDERIYQRLTSVGFARSLLGLDEETNWLLDEYLRRFREAGVQLAPEDREALKELNSHIASAEKEFDQRATKAIEDAALVLTEEELAGVDADTRATLAAAAAARGGSGYLLTYLSPSQQPLLTSMTDADARSRVLASSLARGGGVSEATDTRAVLLRLARLRAERAVLLGHENHASVVAASGTAKSADAVAERLTQLAGPAARNAAREAEELAHLKAEADPAPFEASDWAFYEERQRARLFSVDDASLRPYLELWQVIEKGVFFAANQLFGITFTPRPELKGYAEDVRVWEVREEDGRPIGLFLGDFYARKGKAGGAWMHNLVEQSWLKGTRPVVVNNLNIPKPPEGEPTLLTWDETRTAFHEFGHALHGLFSAVQYPSLEGTNVPRDFVEFPSQVNEMWMVNRAVLSSFARHHITGEPLAPELVERLMSMGTFGQGFATSEYLQAALLDQAWHRLAPAEVPAPEDSAAVAEFELAALAAAGIGNPLIPPRYRSTYFNHAFGGGYDANYYAYIWSETMDADTVEWFKNEGAATDAKGVSDGGLNRRAGDYFRAQLLSRGNSRDPLESYRQFRGRDAEIAPLLARRGLEA